MILPSFISMVLNYNIKMLAKSENDLTTECRSITQDHWRIAVQFGRNHSIILCYSLASDVNVAQALIKT